MKFDLIFALKAKSVLVKKGATSLNLSHPLMILALALSVLSSPIPDVLPRLQKISTISTGWSYLILYVETTLLCLVLIYTYFNFKPALLY